jgi:protein gp37
MNDCPYCYARQVARRFGTLDTNAGVGIAEHIPEHGVIVEISSRISGAPYPYDFVPTFHRYRLDEPQRMKKPRTIFVCSMADLFGDWVPGEWIQDVFKACESAPQHTYLFLTKNPDRYQWVNNEDGEAGEPNLALYGTPYSLGATVTNQGQLITAYESAADWISIEPMLEHLEFDEMFTCCDRYVQDEVARWSWIVIGAETGNRKDKVVPKREWIDEIVYCSKYYKTPIFMKDSLVPVMGEENMLREFPEFTDRQGGK